jgi:DNA-binding transcriptional ArsR family regulator
MAAERKRSHPLRDLAATADAAHLLADATRLGVLFLLAGGETNVSALCTALRCAEPTCCHHLGILRMHHVVVRRRRGKQVFYALATSTRSTGRISVDAGGGAITIERV